MPQEQYIQQEAEARAKAFQKSSKCCSPTVWFLLSSFEDEARLLHAKPRIFPSVPGNVKIEPLEITESDLYNYLTSGKARVKKDHGITRLRAIWFNRLVQPVLSRLLRVS